MHPLAFGYDASVPPYTYDPKKAKELLAQAGYPNGVDITLHSAFVEFRPVFEAIGPDADRGGDPDHRQDVGPGPGV